MDTGEFLRVWLPPIAQILVAVATFVLAYFVYVQIRETRTSRARELHTEDLKGFLNLLKEGISSTRINPSYMIMKSLRTFSSDLEDHPFFEDLDNHLFKGSKLKECYEGFKEFWGDYWEVASDLHSTIRADGCAKTGMRFTTSNEIGLKRDFLSKLYSQYISYTLRGAVEHKEPFLLDTEEKPHGFEVYFGGYTIAVAESEEKAKGIVQTYANMMKDFTNHRYTEPVDELKDVLSDFEDEQTDLLRQIDEILAQPLYQKDCKFIRRSTGSKIRFRRRRGKTEGEKLSGLLKLNDYE